MAFPKESVSTKTFDVLKVYSNVYMHIYKYIHIYIYIYILYANIIHIMNIGIYIYCIQII